MPAHTIFTDDLAAHTCPAPSVPAVRSMRESTAPQTAEQLLHIQRDLAAALQTAHSPEECLRLLLSAALRLNPFCCGGIYRLDPDTGAFQLAHHLGMEAELANTLACSFPVGSPLAARFAEGRLVITNTADMDQEIGRPWLGQDIGVMVTLPIRCGDRMIAGLMLTAGVSMKLTPALSIALEGMVATTEIACNPHIAMEQGPMRTTLLAADREQEPVLATEHAAHLDLALEVSDAALSEWDLKSNRLGWHRRIKQLYGFAENENVTFKALILRIHPDDRDRVLRETLSLAQSDTHYCLTQEYRILHPVRGHRWIQRRASIEHDSAGKPLRTLGICIDVTERKLLEEKLHQINQSLEEHLNSVQTELRHANRLGIISEVSAGILHQVSQPLCSLEINLTCAINQLRTRPEDHTETLETLMAIESEFTRLRTIFQHLKAIAVPGPPSFVTVNLNQVIAEAAKALANVAKRQQTALQLDLFPELPAIQGDPVQLSQVIVNLVQNAIDACGNRPVEERQVTIRTHRAGNRQIRMEVVDTGTGIDEAISRDLFAPFLTTKPQGLGIGLRLSQTIIRSHGGTIRGANLTADAGAVFMVDLPVQIPSCYT